MSYSFSPKFFHSPGYLLLDVPQAVKQEISLFLNELNEDNEGDYDHIILGNQRKAQTLPVGEALETLMKKLSCDYCDTFLGGAVAGSKFFAEKKFNYEVGNLWVNFFSKGDYSPPHNHKGVFSFVIWVKVPYSVEEEDKKSPGDTKVNGRFYFQRPDSNGDSKLETLPVDHLWEWKMIFFDANLIHGVFPFYSSNEQRVSIAGNVFLC